MNSAFRIENDVLEGEEVDYPTNPGGLGKFVLDSLEEDLDFVGQVDAASGEEYTYGWTRERSVRCALWMRSRGVRPGDVVAICSDDHPDFAIPCYAALYLGAIFTLWDEGSDAEQFLHELNLTKPKMIFVRDSLVAAITGAKEEAELDADVIVFGRVSGFLDFSFVIAEANFTEVREFECRMIESSDEIAAIIFSSGSTGPAKGVALSHRALMMTILQSKLVGMAGSVCFIVTISHWICMIDSLFMIMFVKSQRIILPPFEEKTACALIEKYKASWIFLSPWNINRLVKSNVLRAYDLSSLRTVVHSGGTLSATSYEALTELLPTVNIFGAYGLTECCGYLSLQSSNSKPGSSGKLMTNTKLKVIDPDTGRTLGANRKGEILMKSNIMMSFYYNDPKATAEAVDDEGWLRTGDFGYYDLEGEIFVVDRLKDIIRLEYIDVCPSPIESLISTHPGVKEVAVVGKPRDQAGDILIAFVVKTENYPEVSEQVTATEIVNLVAAKFPKTHQLRAGVKFLDRLPKTPTNKIRRIALRDLAKSE